MSETWRTDARCIQPDMGGKHQMSYGVDIRERGEMVGRCHLGGGRIGTDGRAERAAARMHLIAAAPEMAEALRLCIRAFEDAQLYIGDMEEEQLEAVRSANAALAKAEGGE